MGIVFCSFIICLVAVGENIFYNLESFKDLGELKA